MRHDVASNGFLCVCCKHSRSINLSHDLIRDNNSHTKLVRKAHQEAQELGKMHLSCCKFASPRIVCAVQSSSAVNNEQSISVQSEESTWFDRVSDIIAAARESNAS